jgi:hypothetical protein
VTSVSWEVAEIGRLLHAHRLDPVLACSPLALSVQGAERLAAAGEIATTGVVIPDHAALLLDILNRLELRCRDGSRALAAARERSASELGGKLDGEALRQSIDTDRLGHLREVAGTVRGRGEDVASV